MALSMQQPDPAGLFEPLKQHQGQPRTPPAGSSVMAQIGHRQPETTQLPQVQSAAVSQAPPSAPSPPPTPSPEPVNPFTALYQSGAMEQSIARAANESTQTNPLTRLFNTGAMTKSVLAAEDEDYIQALTDYENRTRNPLNTMYDVGGVIGTPPTPPNRTLEQIGQDWRRGAPHLREPELGQIFQRVETGKLTPKQEALVSELIEPALTPALKRELNISRMTRDQYQAIKADYDQQMAEQERLKATLGPEERRQLTSAGQMEQFRATGRGLSFGNAYAPDDDRLNSDNPEEVARERALRWFYEGEQAEHPIASFAGEMVGGAATIGALTVPLRGLRTLNASRNLIKPGQKSAETIAANRAILARAGAPASLGGNVLEGTLASLPYDALYRIPRSEEMTPEQLRQARSQQLILGAAIGAAGDVGLALAGRGGRKLIEGAARAGEKVTRSVDEALMRQQEKRLDRQARELGYDSLDHFADAFTEIVTDETGSRIRLKAEALEGLPDPTREKIQGMLPGLKPSEPKPSESKPSESDHVPGAPTPADTQPDLSRAEQDRPALTDLRPPLEPEAPAHPERLAAGPAETSVSGRSEPAIENEAPAEFKALEPPKQEAKVKGLQVVEAPVEELALSMDVPQFKSGADTKGVVEPLGGRFDRTGVGPIQIWVRKDGSKEVISGRHRLDLARRSGEKTIPAQYHYESEGFGRQQAATLDALLNIREGQGKVKDYVDYFRERNITREAADAEGILGRATGQRAYTIATDGTEQLIAAHRADRITDEGAARIARAAPGDERLQAVGIKAIEDGKSITVAENMVKAVRSMTGDRPPSSNDLFGFDDSALKEAEQLARRAAAKQADIQKTLSAVQGAAKNPALAAREGVDVNDPEALNRRIESLRQQKQDWQNWHTNPDLVAELRSDLGLSRTGRATEPEPEPEAPTLPEVPESQGGFFNELGADQGFDLTQPTAKELEAKAKAEQEALAKEQQEQAALEARAKADAEVNDFELGIQGSGKDVSTRQGDMGGWFRTAEEGTVAKPSQKVEPSVAPINGKRTLYRRGHRKGRWWSDDKIYTELYKESSTHKDEVAQVDFDNLEIWDTVNDPNGSARIFDNKSEDEMAEIIKNHGFDAARLEGEDGQNIFFLAKNVDEISEQSLKPALEPHHTQPSLKTEAASKAGTADIRGTEPTTPAKIAQQESLQAEAQQQAKIEAEPATAAMETAPEKNTLDIEPITEGVHTKKGTPVFNVKVNTRLGKEKFAEAAKEARKLGGSYYKGQFSLPTREKAEQFSAWLNGQSIDRTPARMEAETKTADTEAQRMRREAEAIEAKQNKQVEGLRKKADQLEAKGEEEYHRDRLTNTPKRLSQATSARAAAERKIRFARTLRNIANGIEDGSIRLLTKLNSLTQLELLTGLERRAIPSSMMDEGYDGYRMSRSKKEGVTLEDYIDQITLPNANIYIDNARKLIEAMKSKRGFSHAWGRLQTQLSVAIRSDKRWIELPAHGELTADIDKFVGSHKTDPGWQFTDSIKTIKALQRLGITTDEQLRAAIRELETVKAKSTTSAKDHQLDAQRLKIKQNARGFNDFFPTPEAPTNRLMELAEIEPGMKTLEPNGGMGHIAGKLEQAAGAENVDIVEMSSQLVDYLKTAGHRNVTQSDFMTFGSPGTYDRIVMNPPFSKNQDIDHVRRAYELLKPGGRVTAIVSNMAGLRSDGKNRAFSQWLDEVGAYVEDIEPGAFKSSFNPTSVNTKILVIDKPDSSVSSGGTLYSLPIFQTRQDLYRGLSGGIYGGATSEYEVGSDEWWADVALWGAGGAIAGKAAARLGVEAKNSNFYKRHLLPFNLWATKNRPLDANKFTEAPNGTFDFGYISEDIAIKIGSKPGIIRLQRGWDFLSPNDKGKIIHRGFGLRHIERDERLQNLVKYGYKSPKEFIFDVTQNYERIYRGKKDSFILAKDANTGKHAGSVFIEFDKGKDGVFYATNTGLIARKRYLKNKELLWDRSAARSGIKPQESASRLQAVPTDLRQSSSLKSLPESAGSDKNQPGGTSLFSNPVIPAARQVASMMHLNPGGAVGGAVYGGIAAGDASEAERYSPQWWLDSVFGAMGGAMAGAAFISGAKKIPLKGKNLLGKNSWGSQATDFLGNKISQIPGMNQGDKDVLPMKKQQQLMKALIERQGEKAGQYLLDNFTPSQRAAMADLIEQRGIIADGNLLHRQAQELDDFIAFTAKKLQDLGMLDETIEPGAYLHRYYEKDLGLGGLMRQLRPGGKSLSGTWSKRRGTQEVFDRRYMSQSMRATLDRIAALQTERANLKKQAGDLMDADTRGRIDALNGELKTLQETEFREYMAVENGKLKSFFLASDEVPTIPGLTPGSKTGLPEPVRQGTLEGIEQPRTIGKTGQLALTDRRWTIDGQQGSQGGILHRDWTKTERDSWGEIHDGAYRMVRGQAEVAHDLSLGTFFKQVNDRFQGSKVSDDAIEGWIQVPDTRLGKGSRLKKYGALSGKYVTPDVWAAIKHQGRNPLLNWTNNHPAVKNYLKLLGKWKAYKTVYNPVSHMNNTVGNLGMYYLSDYSPRHLATAMKEIRQGEASKLYREARDNGLFGTDYTSTLDPTTGNKTLDELLEKLRIQPEVPDLNESLNTLMEIKQWFIESRNAVRDAPGAWRTGGELVKAIGNPLVNTARKPIHKAANSMQSLYRMEDEFFKMAVYVGERQKGTKPFDAVRAANNYFFDYGEMPTAMKVVRDSPWGSPFISYTYYAIPAIVRTAVEKPEKLFAFAAFLEGVNYAGMAINGELQDQGYWDRMADDEEILPSWMKGRSLWGGLNNISIPFVDSYKLGLANALPAGNPMAGNAERSGAWPEALSFWGPGPEGSNPMMRLIFDLANNQDWRGNPIWDEGSPSSSEKIRKATNYIYQNITPSNPLFPGSYHQQKLFEGMANEVRTDEADGDAPNQLVDSVLTMANATAETLGAEQFTGLDRRENDILFRDALWGALGVKLRPVRLEQMEESRQWEVRNQAEALNQWMTKKERAFSEKRITEKQIKAYRRMHQEAANELAESSEKAARAL